MLTMGFFWRSWCYRTCYRIFVNKKSVTEDNNWRQGSEVERAVHLDPSFILGIVAGAMSSNYSVLEPFDVSTGIDGWMEWMERFVIFAEANNVPPANRRTVSLNQCGPQLYRLVREAVTLKKPSSMSFEALIEAVQGRFDPIPGIYTARAEFYARKQQPDEPVAVFMTNLRRLARRCQYEASPTVAERVDAQLQDLFIIGMCDAETRRRILRGLKLPLKEVYSLALLGETVATQSRLLEERAAGSPVPTVHALANKNKSGRSNQVSFGAEGTKCLRCDKKGHSADFCRFKELLCHRCHKKEHVSKVCRSSLPTTSYQQESAIFGNSRGTDRRRSVHAVEQTPSRDPCSTWESEDDL
ncbi:hypothetical protein TTRE_0000857101 [Trichuris trichiura]|uniref:CCHC-type domain-containing protein n=1 Tax=Trichuris trichiura TaxID=36087 RepID=A0A077ZIJ5_TRITR|nr:hypothetical protein TTRE_0000857101 [Trichuris trichiura]